MTRMHLTYRNGDGIVSERSISDWTPDGEDAVDAYCHLRNERRTFKLQSILRAVDEDTGEVVGNLWRCFGLDRAANGTVRIEAALGERMTAIKVLKFYAKSTRGFAKREREHILNFAFQGTNAHEHSREDADVWLQGLWAGDVYAYKSGEEQEYNLLLSALPSSQRAEVRVTAELIARGSGRRAISPEAAQRIARDFASAP